MQLEGGSIYKKSSKTIEIKKTYSDIVLVEGSSFWCGICAEQMKAAPPDIFCNALVHL
jgi:hypothetical protein